MNEKKVIQNDKVEIACKDLVFHFNKGFLKDPSIPMWVVKTKGKTYYVDHVDANIPWTTKETPDNEHTKGSLKFKNCLCTIDESNCATLSVLTEEDKIRLGAVPKQPPILWLEGYSPDIEQLLKDNEIANQGVLQISGSCTSNKQMAGIYDVEHMTFLALLVPDMRILNENEPYYKHYVKWIENNPVCDVVTHRKRHIIERKQSWGGNYKSESWLNAEHHLFRNIMLGKNPRLGFSPKSKRKLQEGETPWISYDMACGRIERVIKGYGVKRFLEPFEGNITEKELKKITLEDMEKARKLHK